MAYVYLGLGSNVGNREQNLQRAVHALGQDFANVNGSPIYETKPKYNADQPEFLNAVVKAYTEKPVKEVVAAIQSVEKRLGKKKQSKNGPRNIDIDFLFYDAFVGNQDGFIVPHPKIAERAFVLAPLKDVAPHLLHPVLKKTVQQLWDELPEQEKKSVKKMDSKLPAVHATLETIPSIGHAEKRMRDIGVQDTYSVKSMAQKTISLVIRLENVRATMANILKQEMLALGGDAAVHKDCISNKIEKSDVLLIGTVKQLRQLVSKLRVQVAEAQDIAFAVDQILRRLD
ncbi:2-amino-4-hydroxy-6-hydroxymethyldihydropteridine diphosphokinase [Candidatus Micrarchaeota archaeon]|nr:2-amino-4-hydroxy-6-hydroxymethyldihydropteridine diphosphokinase [Candidatus Micrarchaeota archaeon]